LIYIGDRQLKCEVTEITDDGVAVEVKSDGVIQENDKIRIPDAVIEMPILTEQDESDIMEFGINKDVDLIAVSYVRK